MEQQTSQPDIPSVPMLHDGELVFHVKRNCGETTEHRVDLLALKLTCEELEEKHGLQEKDGRMVSTAAFLLDLAAHIEAFGVEKCTPTMAWQMWISASEEMQNLKNELSEMPNSPTGTDLTPEG